MKKFLFSLVMVALVAFSCKKDEKPALELSKNGTIEVVSGASEQSITVKTNQKTWTAKSDANWVEVAQNGEILKLNIKENTTTEARKANITITAGSLNEKIIINQAGLTVTLEVTPKLIEATSETKTYPIEVKTNFNDWTFSSNANWAVATKSGNILNIEVKENNNTEERNAEIIVKAGNEQSVISVKQAAMVASVEIKPASLEIEGVAGDYTFEVISNVTWDVECAESWVKVKKQDEKTVAINVEENNSNAIRTAKILVKYNNGKSNKEFELTQKAVAIVYSDFLPYLDVDATFEDVDAFETNRGGFMTVQEAEGKYLYTVPFAWFIRYQFYNPDNTINMIEYYSQEDIFYTKEFADAIEAAGFVKIAEGSWSKDVKNKAGKIYTISAKIWDPPYFCVCYLIEPKK